VYVHLRQEFLVRILMKEIRKRLLQVGSSLLSLFFWKEKKIFLLMTISRNPYIAWSPPLPGLQHSGILGAGLQCLDFHETANEVQYEDGLPPRVERKKTFPVHLVDPSFFLVIIDLSSWFKLCFSEDFLYFLFVSRDFPETKTPLVSSRFTSKSICRIVFSWVSHTYVVFVFGSEFNLGIGRRSFIQNLAVVLWS